MRIFKPMLIAFVVLVSQAAMAHSGGTDKNGCHTERETGTYHCH